MRQLNALCDSEIVFQNLCKLLRNSKVSFGYRQKSIELLCNIGILLWQGPRYRLITNDALTSSIRNMIQHKDAENTMDRKPEQR